MADIGWISNSSLFLLLPTNMTSTSDYLNMNLFPEQQGITSSISSAELKGQQLLAETKRNIGEFGWICDFSVRKINNAIMPCIHHCMWQVVQCKNKAHDCIVQLWLKRIATDTTVSLQLRQHPLSLCRWCNDVHEGLILQSQLHSGWLNAEGHTQRERMPSTTATDSASDLGSAANPIKASASKSEDKKANKAIDQ